jgi:hypothetical protein
MKWNIVLVSAVLLVIAGACISVEATGSRPFDWPTSIIWRSSIGAGGGRLWLLGNFAYTGMRAQGNRSIPGWRVLAFIAGLPGTILSRLAVKEGSERAHGVDLPRRVPKEVK